MNKPTIQIVGTPDLPEGVVSIFGDKLLVAHEKLTIDGALIGYRVSFMDEGVPMLSNCLVGDDGVTYYEDDVQEMAGEPSTFVPCRTDYHVCPECLREIRAHAHIIEGESEEDRPHPAIGDAWDRVEGCDGFCGGNRCENPPQRVYWTSVLRVSVRDFPSTMDASMTISSIVQWDAGLIKQTSAETMTPDEINDAYEALLVKSSGHFLRLNLDPDTGKPIMPGADFLHSHADCIENHTTSYVYRYHGFDFVVGWDSDTTHRAEPGWMVYPKTTLPEAATVWG